MIDLFILNENLLISSSEIVSIMLSLLRNYYRIIVDYTVIIQTRFRNYKYTTTK